jgi:hypothetical protein
MAHDQFWKEVLTAFFREFMELFFPDVAAKIDFDAGVGGPNKEVFTDVPEGRRREVDLVFEVVTRDGGLGMVLVHVEVQKEREPDMPFRMWEYYHLLRLRRRHLVFPAVLCLAPGAGGLTEERYTEGAFGRVTEDFRYSVVGLPDLSAEEYSERENVLAPALAVLMKSASGSRVVRKLRAYERIARAHVDEARKWLLVSVVERYLTLDAAEAAEFERAIGDDEGETGMKTLFDRGVDYGLELGELKAKRATLRRLAARKAGDLPESVVARIEAIEDPEALDAFIDRIADAQSLADMGLTEH